ncbi:flagellar motor switch phosphatase FliY [Natranaerofaba carboxydovora]|uniref:flagellar motor switch phosphatase FliY n=1 Tax=Natranaerofaba carboxydovora TaxID=2742683 RepID=UPI001F145B72|nr:flagellar motor switch phosphatase FliY [Natranaerofaba carboxydovora]UMZ73371.1 Flagellar motor switch protein FliN [Natranaerofaba carboxydovora]
MENNDNKDILSQEEIDALLKGDSSGGEESKGEESASPADGDVAPSESSATDANLTDVEKDAIGEIGNISFGTAATTLSVLLNKQVEITTPKVSITNYKELRENFPKPHVLVEVEYTEGLQGVNVLIIKMKDAKIIADLMMGGDGENVTDDDTDIEEFHLSAVSEAMNQMMGSASTSMSTMFSNDINISPPSSRTIDLAEDDLDSEFPEEPMVKVSFDLKIEGLIDSEIMQIVPLKFAKNMAGKLLGGSEEPAEPEKEPESAPAPEKTEEPPAAKAEQPAAPSAQEQVAAASQNLPAGQQQQPTKDYQPVQFGSLEEQQQPAQADTTNMGLILDVPLEVTVELGRTRKSIKDVLELVPGSIIELEKLAGEPVDIKVNGKLIAKGEVVVIDENFGVRVTEIVSPMERVNKLQ